MNLKMALVSSFVDQEGCLVGYMEPQALSSSLGWKVYFTDVCYKLLLSFVKLAQKCNCLEQDTFHIPRTKIICFGH